MTVKKKESVNNMENSMILFVLCFFFLYTLLLLAVMQARINDLKAILSAQDESGWEDEAKFWRNVYKPLAEAKRLENEDR